MNKIKIIKNTKNCCCRCKGYGKDCEDGGAWIYCTNIPELEKHKDYNETGETDGCNLFNSKK